MPETEHREQGDYWKMPDPNYTELKRKTGWKDCTNNTLEKLGINKTEFDKMDFPTYEEIDKKV